MVEQEEEQVVTNHQNLEAENNIKNFFGQKGEEEKFILEHKPSFKTKPYISSTPEYSLTSIDQQKVGQLRDWSRQFFQNEIVYEGTLFMTLNKVREFIQIENSKTEPQSF